MDAHEHGAKLFADLSDGLTKMEALSSRVNPDVVRFRLDPLDLGYVKENQAPADLKHQPRFPGLIYRMSFRMSFAMRSRLRGNKSRTAQLNLDSFNTFMESLLIERLHQVIKGMNIKRL